MKERIVIFTGAGMSAESGLETFRGVDGLWENHKIEDVATLKSWKKNPALVQDFFNQRRKVMLEAEPNAGHLYLVRLQERYNLHIITQNIDDLHERAGSRRVLHLHGEIKLAQSDLHRNLTYPVAGWEIKMGEECEFGSQLRPNVVLFGEDVGNYDLAAKICSKANIFIIIGTKLAVARTASVIEHVPRNALKYIIDPKIPDIHSDFTKIELPATLGIKKLVDELLAIN